MTTEETLISFEKEFHSSLASSNQARIDELLAEDFYEFGSSGNIWTKKDILARHPVQASNLLKIESRNYSVKELSPKVFLVNYISYRMNNMKEERLALRSSVWKKVDSHWKMLFHQGTFKQ